MELKAYFEDAQGFGLLSTADKDGKVDAAVYSRPHFMDDGTMPWSSHCMVHPIVFRKTVFSISLMGKGPILPSASCSANTSFNAPGRCRPSVTG